jgi:hypothetical protein
LRGAVGTFMEKIEKGLEERILEIKKLMMV